MLNQPDKLTDSRIPRAVVKVNDAIVVGWLEWEVDNNTFYQADTFRVKFALSKMEAPYTANWWMTQPSLFVEILVGFPKDPNNYSASELTSWIYGQVDDVTLDPVSRTIEVSGRDLTAQMIDTKTTEKWQNLTSSQIAAKIAAAHNLTPVVTATSIKAGKYYEIDHARMTDQRSEWDLLTALAHEEGFVVFVRGKSLYFQPKPDPNSAPYLLHWQEPEEAGQPPKFNGTSLLFARNLTLAKDVIVQVRSWNVKNKKGYTKTAQATHNKNTVLAGAAQPVGEAQVYSYTIPNLTPEQALKKAQAILKEITAHEVRVDVEMPADNILDVTTILQVIGTETALDQIYYPDSIKRKMNEDEGYTMTVLAKNHSPETVTGL